MPHNQNHLYAIKESDGEVVFVDDVTKGKNCGCICSKCKKPLVAKNGGEIYIHHFAHYSGSNCTGETLAHLEAKAIIKKEKYLWLPASEEDHRGDHPGDQGRRGRGGRMGGGPFLALRTRLPFQTETVETVEW